MKTDHGPADPEHHYAILAHPGMKTDELWLYYPLLVHIKANEVRSENSGMAIKKCNRRLFGCLRAPRAREYAISGRQPHNK